MFFTYEQISHISLVLSGGKNGAFKVHSVKYTDQGGVSESLCLPVIYIHGCDNCNHLLYRKFLHT